MVTFWQVDPTCRAIGVSPSRSGVHPSPSVRGAETLAPRIGVVAVQGLLGWCGRRARTVLRRAGAVPEHVGATGRPPLRTSPEALAATVGATVGDVLLAHAAATAQAV